MIDNLSPFDPTKPAVKSTPKKFDADSLRDAFFDFYQEGYLAGGKDCLQSFLDALKNTAKHRESISFEELIQKTESCLNSWEPTVKKTFSQTS